MVRRRLWSLVMVVGILFCVIFLSSTSFLGVSAISFLGILTWSVGIIVLSCVCICGLLFDGFVCKMWETLFRYWMMMGYRFWVFVFFVPLIVTLLLTSFCLWMCWVLYPICFFSAFILAVGCFVFSWLVLHCLCIF